MCLGTYIVSYSCGHVAATPNVCLRDVGELTEDAIYRDMLTVPSAPHYRCEPRGMKITQPNGRCVECYSRDLAPHQHLTTTARFNPDPKFAIEERQTLTPQSSVDSSERNAAITRWYSRCQSHRFLYADVLQDYGCPCARSRVHLYRESFATNGMLHHGGTHRS